MHAFTWPLYGWKATCAVIMGITLLVTGAEYPASADVERTSQNAQTSLSTESDADLAHGDSPSEDDGVGSTTQVPDADLQEKSEPVEPLNAVPETVAPYAQPAAPGNGIMSINVTLPGTKTVGGDLNKTYRKTDGTGWTTVEASKDSKEEQEQFTAAVTNPDGSALGTFKVDNMRGRGNFTWSLEKKPYQLKFKDKQDLLGLGKNEAAKTWILLANHADASLMRNKLVYDLANKLGMSYSPESRFVDLTVGGNYLGNYLLVEKIEVGKGRVNLTDDRGVLVELDNSYGAREPAWSRFTTSQSKTTFVLSDAKSDIPKDGFKPGDQSGAKQGWDAFKNKVVGLEKLLYADKPDWAAIAKQIDVDSFLRYYFITELTENSDSIVSSAYFYMDGPGDKLHIGPVWDYDIGLGNFPTLARGINTTENYVKNATLIQKQGNSWFRELFRNPDFLKEANEEYADNIRAQLEQIPTQIEANRAQISASAIANFRTWPILAKRKLFGYGTYRSTHDKEVQDLTTWLNERKAYLDGLYGAPSGVAVAKMPILAFSTHAQNIGWQAQVTNGMRQGTEGKSLRLEALKATISNTSLSGEIQASAHVQDIGWLGWKDTASTIGTVGQGKRIEAIKLRLTGELEQNYNLYYRVHVQDVGWMGWARNGGNAGTSGMSRRIESIEITLLRKGTAVNSSGDAFQTSGRTTRFYSNVDEVSTSVTGQNGEIRVRGWAFDAADPRMPINTDVYVTRLDDGQTKGIRLDANQQRADVDRAFPFIAPGAAHGFDGAVKVDRGGTYQICVYAAVNGNDHSDPICLQTGAFVGQSSAGVLDEVRSSSAASGALGILVRGWAFDRNVPAAQQAVHIYYQRDGDEKPTKVFTKADGTPILADQSRPDVQRAFGLPNDRHGLDAQIPLPKAGTYKVCAYAIGTNWRNKDNNPLLGCKSVAVK